MLLYSVLCLAWVLYPEPVVGQTGAQAKALYTQLFTTDAYNARIRPANDQSQPTEVSVSFNLMAINEVNIVEQYLKVTGYLDIEWMDDFLTWTPSSYGGITEYHWPQNDVWKPDLTLDNSYSDFEDLGTLALVVTNLANGTMKWTPFEVLTSTCSIDVTDFPFDTQTCTIEFVSWGYSPSKVILTVGGLGFALDEFKGSSGWTVDSTKAYTVTDSDDVTIIFEISLTRDPTYVLVVVILPILLLSVLNIFVFLLPCDSGEKASYAITVFLAFAVFFTVISSILPETVAIVMVYAALMTVSSTLTCLIVLAQVRSYGFEEEKRKVPRFLVIMVDFARCKTCLKKADQRHNRIKDVNEDKGPRLGKSIQSITDADTESVSHGTKQDGPEARWKDVIDGLDIFFFYFFTIYFIICTIILFAIVLP